MSGLCDDEVAGVFRGPGEFPQMPGERKRESGAGSVGLPQRRMGCGAVLILLSRKNGGSGVQALRTKARPWRLKFFRA